MKYQMYYEMMEQPEALRRTFASELDNMANISKLAQSVDTIYLIGCGSSISTCYSIRDALASVSDLRIEVFTGYEFVYNKKLSEGETYFLLTCQRGEGLLKAGSETAIIQIRPTEKENDTLKTVYN